MAARAVAAGLVNFSVRTEWLALLTCGADAAECARELVVMIILADCCWMRLAFFLVGRRALSGQSSVAFGCRLARRHSEMQYARDDRLLMIGGFLKSGRAR